MSWTSFIDTAIPRNGSRPVVHIPYGSYAISQTLKIPTGSDVQVVGEAGARPCDGPAPQRGPWSDSTGRARGSLTPCQGGAVASTRDEAHGVRGWLEQRPGHRLIIRTDPFHTRRVRFIFERELKGLAVQLTVIDIPNRRYDPLE